VNGMKSKATVKNTHIGEELRNDRQLLPFEHVLRDSVASVGMAQAQAQTLKEKSQARRQRPSLEADTEDTASATALTTSALSGRDTL